MVSLNIFHQAGGLIKISLPNIFVDFSTFSAERKYLSVFSFFPPNSKRKANNPTGRILCQIVLIFQFPL